jgi:hypothetical protein
MPRNTLGWRLAISLLIGVVVFWTTFGAIGFADKLLRYGLEEAFAWTMSTITDLTFAQCARLICLSTGLTLVGCFPAYAAPTPASLMRLLVCAAFAAVALASWFSFEAWYSFGHLAFPPPGLILTLALVGLALSMTSRAVFARFTNGRRI